MIPAMRRKARRFALQGLYEAYMSQNLPKDIENHLMEEIKTDKVDVLYFQELLYGVCENPVALDELYAPYLDKHSLDELTPIECCVLRLASYELKAQFDVPYQVVISEALELSKRYGAADAHKFINAVLDKLAPTLRPMEVKG